MKAAKRISGATVQLKGTKFGAVTDKAGHYRIRKVPAGTYDVVVSDIDYQSRTVEGMVVKQGVVTSFTVGVVGNERMQFSDPNVRAVEVKGKSYGVIQGVVRDMAASPGEPIGGVSVHMLDLGRGSISDIAGRFHFRQVRPGVYHLGFSSFTHRVKVDTIEVKAGEVSLVTVDLERKNGVENETIPWLKSIRGEVVDSASGEPLVGVSILIAGTKIGGMTNPDGIV